MNIPPRYVTNEDGEKTDVILSIASYEALLEDIKDLTAIADRRNEETISHSDFVAELKEDGIL